MLWRDCDEFLEETEATWEELSQFNRHNFRFLTFSEFDRFEKTSLFFYEQIVPSIESVDRDFIPLNFLSILFIESHKGKL